MKLPKPLIPDAILIDKENHQLIYRIHLDSDVLKFMEDLHKFILNNHETLRRLSIGYEIEQILEFIKIAFLGAFKWRDKNG